MAASNQDAGFLASLLSTVDSTIVAVVVSLTAAVATLGAAIRLVFRIHDAEKAAEDNEERMDRLEKALKGEIDKVGEKVDNLSDKLDRHAEMTTRAFLRFAEGAVAGR